MTSGDFNKIEKKLIDCFLSLLINCSGVVCIFAAPYLLLKLLISQLCFLNSK